MTRIRVDPSLLSQQSNEIERTADEVARAAGELSAQAERDIRGSSFPEFRVSARSDAALARELMDQIRRDLSGHSVKLAALSRAFQSADDETIILLNAMTGLHRLEPNRFGPQSFPDIDGLEPYDLPQTEMAITNWAVMYDSGLKTILHTYRIGELIGNIVGSWTDAQTGRKYSVVDLGNGKFGYIPADRLSGPIDFSKIPFREGFFYNGETDSLGELPAPMGADRWKSDWRRAGDPWQNLILGFMHIVGIDNAVFRKTAHANLCGEMCVMYSVGETDIENGLSVFAQLTGLGYWDESGKKVEYTGTHVLQNPNHPTSAYDLTRYFQAYGYQSGSSGGVLPTPEKMADQLASGHKFIFLTELDTLKEIPSKETGALIANPTYGQLVPGAPKNTPGRAAHWVALTDVFQDANGDVEVEVFNPYTGQKETYSWETFVKTCQQPGNSGGSFGYIEAWK
jgi:hypothetical protein